MAVNNATILGDFWLSGTNDYQQRVPNPTQAGVAATARAIFDPTNRDIYNAFCNFMVQVPAFSYTRAQSFENGLKSFVKRVTYGGGFLENQIGWVTAHSYQADAETLLKTHFPRGAQAYHSQNRQDTYPITLNRDALRAAMMDEYGLNNVASAIMQAPINSDEYDTYRIMLNLLAERDKSDAIYTVHYDSVPSTESEARNLLSDMVAWSKRITFPSVLYNATASSGEPIATFSKPEQMVLMVTPEIYGLIGVKGLGMLFNMEQGEVPYRTIVVDEFPVANVFAVLCDESWFQCYDTEYGNYSFFNPETLGTTYFLQHWGIYSASPFAPIICFGTREVTEGSVVTQSVTGVNITAAETKVAAGGSTQLTVELVGTISPESEGVTVSPDAVTWTIVADGVTLNSRTRVDRNGVLHLQAGLTAGTVVTVTGTTTYTNPSGATTDYSKSVSITVA